MSDSNSAPPAGEGERGILASLPHTRPQRPSARRATSREQAAKRSTTAGKATKSAPATPAKPKSPASPKRPKAPRTRPAKIAQASPARAPRQGFESDGDLEPGKSVTPPSSAEMAASVVELLGELAQSGLTSGGRLLREALGRLPGT